MTWKTWKSVIENCIFYNRKSFVLVSNVAGLKMEKVAGVFLLQFLLTRIREEEDEAVSVN